MVTGIEPASVPGYQTRSFTIKGRDFGIRVALPCSA